ncbi:glycosyltransferase family protein [Arenicellales bacterium IMCC55707]
MAKIIITHFSGIFWNGDYQSSCFYDGLVAGLVSDGHDVLQILSSDFLCSPWNGSNTPFSRRYWQKALAAVIEFEPDLIISFNNSSIDGIEEVVTCPIALWDADSFKCFNDKKKVIDNQDRYCFFSFSTDGLKDYAKFINSKSALMARVPAATHVFSQDIEKKLDISFIGNAFLNSNSAQNFLVKNPEFVGQTQKVLEEKLNSAFEKLQTAGVSKSAILYQSGEMGRAGLITSLLDQNIKIFGSHDWLQLAILDSRFLRAFDPGVVFSLSGNETVYNQSLCSLNVNHPQATSGYALRVLDIMASSAALISNFSADLMSDFPKLQIATFRSSQELVNLAEQVIKDLEFRKEIVLISNEYIENGYRWKHRFKLISQITGVDLTRGASAGTHRVLRIDGDIDPLVAFLANSLAWRDRFKIRKNRKPFINSKPFINKSWSITPEFVKFLIKKARLLNSIKGKKLYE